MWPRNSIRRNINLKELNSVIDNLSGDTMSDHLTIANVMAAWDGLNAKGGQAKVTAVQEFAYDNFLSQVEMSCYFLG